MEIFLNFGFAWVSVFICTLLSVIFVLRRSVKKNGAALKLNVFLRKYHMLLGIILIATGLVHGLFSSQSVFSLNLGTVSWIVSILLGINWMIRKRLKNLKGWMFYHRILTGVFILSIVVHVVDVGGITVQNYLFPKKLVVSEGDVGGSAKSKSKVSQQSNSGTEPKDTGTRLMGGTYKDGTYEGEAVGFQPKLKVQVELKDNKIVSVNVIEHHEVNERFFGTPVKVIPEKVVESQSINVDTISGATYTSVGIINAVRDALGKAISSGELPAAVELQTNMGRRGRH